MALQSWQPLWACMVDMHRQAAHEPDFVHIQPPYGFLYQGNQSEEMFAKTAASWLEDKILEMGADKIAAFVAEPIKGQAALLSRHKAILSISKQFVSVMIFCSSLMR